MTQLFETNVAEIQAALEAERKAHDETRREWRAMRAKLLTYRHLDTIYQSLVREAEANATPAREPLGDALSGLVPHIRAQYPDFDTTEIAIRFRSLGATL